MPTSPSKRKVLSSVDPKHRITAFFTAANLTNSVASTPAKEPAPSNAAHDAERESSLVSDLTSVATTPTKPSSPWKSPGTTPRIVPVLQRPDHDPIPAPPALQPRPSDLNPSTSFASTTSTVSRNSVPNSSGSSRRIMKNGEQMVIDSDSDGLDDDSDDLPDLEMFLPSKRRKVTPPITTKVEPTSKTAKPLPRPKINFFAPPSSPPKARPKYSLASMVKAKQDAERSDALIAQVESGVAEQELKLQQIGDGTGGLDDDQLKALLGDDSDDAERMKQAMQRTEALENEERFSYFTSSEPCAAAFEFPTDCFPDTSWARILMDEDSRMQACLTGFSAELGAQGRLPLEVTRWFAFQLVRESDPRLCEAYVGILEGCVERGAPVHQSLASLQTFFASGQEQESQLRSESQFLPTPETSTPKDKIECLCGYTDDDGDTVLCDACNTWQHVACYYRQHDGRKLPEGIQHACVSCEPRKIDIEVGQAKQKAKGTEQGKVLSPMKQEAQPLAGLKYVVRVIQMYAPTVGVDIASRAVADLALAAMDDRVIKNPDLREIINRAIDSLVSTIPEDEEDDVLEYLRERLFDDANVSPTMQCRLVLALPALTQPSHDLRRQLALFCVTRDKQSRALSSPNWPKAIAMALNKAKQFSIDDRSTDYGHLTDLVSVLDVAIGPGFSPSSYPWLSTSPPHKSSTGNGLFQRDHGPSHEEDSFNTQVDNIAERLAKIMSRIKDTGVTNLRRMEAKSGIESVLLRLRHSVRTKPPPQKDVFATKEVQEKLSGFFRRAPPADVMMVDEGGE